MPTPNEIREQIATLEKQLREAEVRELRARHPLRPPHGLHKHVLRLQIAVEDLALVDEAQRLRSLQGNARQLEALSRSIESSLLFLEAAIRGENLGLRDLVDVLDARAELYDLRIQFVEVLCQYLGDRTYLEAATGALDTADLVAITARLRELSQAPESSSGA